MDEIYRAYGVGFRYPTGWSLSEDRRDAEVTISLQSPGTSFWSLTLMFQRPESRRVLQTALEAYSDEYEEVDVYGATATLCQRPGIARDLDFVCLDMISSAYLRVFQTERFTALVLYQGDQRELSTTRDEMEAISQSLFCDVDDPAKAD